MTVAYISLGSNAGDRLSNLRRATRELSARGVAVQKASSVYETEPVGPPQADFLNAVVEVATELGARELLDTLKQIETDLGRTPGQRWGPREIDLDLVLYGEEEVNEPGLKVPHPQMRVRGFVLVPLLEISPDVTLPSGELVSQLADPGRRGVKLHAPPGSLL